MKPYSVSMSQRFQLSLPGLFEVRVAEYLDSYPEPEPSGVNKFLKGLGKCYSVIKCSLSRANFQQLILWFCLFLFLFFRKQDEAPTN